MKASDLFVKSLENEGVEYIFGIPGEENLDFLHSLAKSNIQLILTRHEQGAGFMAATYGRLTGKPGVCLSTLGPGATNLLTCAAYAQLGAMPMIILTGQKPIKESKQGKFQIVNIVEVMGPVSKYARQIVNANNIPSVIREAFRLSAEERPGAVHIELPEDIAREEVNKEVIPIAGIRRPIADIKSISAAVELIHQAKMPLILVGAGANRKRTKIALTKFINATQIPFFNTQLGKGVIDERNPLFLGTAALSSNDFIHCAIDRSDLIINVGHDVIEKPPFFMEQNQKKVIHINFFAAEVDDIYSPQLNVVGDIAATIHQMVSKVMPQSHWDFDYFKRVKIDIDRHLEKYFHDDRFPILPQRIVSILRQNLKEEDIITLDNGVYKIWFTRNYKCYAPNTMILDNSLATMGAGFPSAIAAKMIYPDKNIVSVCGDGGFMMNSQETETAVRLNIDITVIILNDSAYGMIKWKQEAMEFPHFGLDFKNPDFVKYADSYGAKGYRPQNVQDFEVILKKCLVSKGVKIIDLSIDYSLNHQILNVLLKEKSCLI